MDQALQPNMPFVGFMLRRNMSDAMMIATPASSEDYRMNTTWTHSAFDYSRQLADTAAKAQGYGLELAEQIFALQLKTAEQQVARIGSLAREALAVRDAATATQLWTRSVEAARAHSADLASTQQEAAEAALKSATAFGDLARKQFEVAQSAWAAAQA